METSKDFAVFELPGSLKLLFNQGAWRECGASNFFVIILFIFVFYHGKLGMQSVGLKKFCFPCFHFLNFFPRRIFFITHQFYLCSKA
jgi:hypothetical protein